MLESILLRSASLLCLLAPAGAQEPAPLDILERHRRFVLGDKPLEAFGDLELRGVMQAGAGDIAYHAWVRRRPFGFREELRPPEALGMATEIMVTNGRSAWRIREGKVAPLAGPRAGSFLEHACFVSLRYLEPGACDVIGVATERVVAPAGGGEVEVDLAHLATPSGAIWDCAFGRADGRLHTRSERYSGFDQWQTDAAWRSFDGLTLPVHSRLGMGSVPRGEWRIAEARAGLALPDALFAGDPAPVSLDASSALVVLPDMVPGGAHLVLPQVTVNERLAAAALLDTGAEFVAIDPGSAGRLGVPLLAGSHTIGSFGGIVSRHAWFDTLQLGDGGPRLPQVLGLATPFPKFPALPGGMRPEMVVGIRPLLRLSMVLDLAAGRLLLRGEVAAPLDADPVLVPYRCETKGSWTMTVDVRLDGKTLPVMVDTGSAAVLALTARGLQQLGLPLAREAWIERGAVALAMHGAGALSGESLLVPMARVELGNCTFERPWVMVILPADPREPGEQPYAGLLGGGAMLPFARVGIDASRQRLELEPGSTIVKAEGRACVRAPGRLAGVLLAAPERDATAGDATLPRVTAVFPGTPAERAGVLAGDRVVAVGALACERRVPTEIYRALWLAEGEGVTLRLRRGDEEIAVEVR